MSGEPIMPQQLRVETDYFGDPCVFLPELSDCHPVVIAPIDAASWRAMVERAARERAFQWASQREDVRNEWRKRAASELRAALNLPDGWTP